MAQLAVTEASGLFTGGTPTAYVCIVSSSDMTPFNVWKVQLDELRWPPMLSQLWLFYRVSLLDGLQRLAQQLPDAQQQGLLWLLRGPQREPAQQQTQHQTQQQQQQLGQQQGDVAPMHTVPQSEPPVTPSRQQREQQE